MIPSSLSHPPTVNLKNKKKDRNTKRRDECLREIESSEEMTIGGGTTTQAYGEPAYWDNRYTQDPGPFDWYQKYPALAPLINLYLLRDHRILVVGCGNAAFSEGMVKDGYKDVVNIDISSVVIEAMKRKYSNCPQLKYIEMDVRDMSAFSSGSFDAVVDKGTLDSLLCGHNSQQNATAMLTEVGRVLKDGGVYILITYGAPLYRLSLLRDPCSWTVKLHVVVGDASSSTSNMLGTMEHEDKSLNERNTEQRIWELTNPVPLDDNGSSVDSALGRNPEVHYIYVCTKDESLIPASKDQAKS